MEKLAAMVVVLVIVGPAILLAFISGLLIVIYPFAARRSRRGVHEHRLPDGRTVAEALAQRRAEMEAMAEQQRFAPDGTDLHAELASMRRAERVSWVLPLTLWLVEVVVFAAAAGAIWAAMQRELPLAAGLVVLAGVAQWWPWYRLKRWRKRVMAEGKEKIFEVGEK